MVVVKVRVDFAMRHIQGAALFCRKAWALEQAHASTPWSHADIEEYQQLCVSAVVSAFFFVEATINYAYVSLEEPGGDHRLDTLDPAARKSLADMWRLELIRGTSPFPKYNVFLDICGKTTFDKGAGLYQKAVIVQQWRNYLAHYSAEFFEVDGKKVGLEQSLINQSFAMPPFTGYPHFPMNVISHGGAEWAVQTSIEFVDEFFKRLNVTPYHDAVRAQLVTR